MSTLHKNAIITGTFDSYCLLCEVHIKRNVENHINVPEHKEKLQHSGYVQKYEFHYIRKVAKGYYCELCNILLPTLVKIGLHVTSSDHENHMADTLLKEVDGGVTAFDRILISYEAWNGLVEGTICCLCNEEFSDKSAHLKQASHILNLIQKNVHIKEHGIVYRKMDDTTLHCMVCNIIFDINDSDIHFESKQHLEQCRKSFDLKKKFDEDSTKASINQTIKQENMPPVIEHSTRVDKKDYDVKSCNDVENQYDTKPKEAKTEPESTENEILRHPFIAKEEARLLAKKNKIIYKFSKQSAYCNVCEVTISSSLQRMKQHIQEMEHEKNLQGKQLPEDCKTKNNKIIKDRLDNFVNCIEMYQYRQSTIESFVVLNQELCMEHMSYLMITVNGEVVRCQVCSVTLGVDDLKSHYESFRHEIAFYSVPVVVSLKGEFVREIRSKTYHCGFCNLVVGGEEELFMHLDSDVHSKNKIACYLLRRMLEVLYR